MKSRERTLIVSAQNGDAEAFAELVSHYRDRLLRFLLLRCGQREDAEDAVQEAMINAWRYLPSYQPRWQFSTWLYRIGINSLTAGRRNDMALDEARTASHDSLHALEMDNVWRLARAQLSEDACSALWLRYAEDASTKQIADVMSRSNAWVKVSLLRSRRKLARIASEDLAP
mgnify:CR=1 FL=1